MQGVLHRDQLPVLAALDVGVNDLTVAWFAQLVGTSIHIIDCIAWHDTALKDVCRDLRDLPYNLTFLGVPHDQRQREQSSNRPK